MRFQCVPFLSGDFHSELVDVSVPESSESGGMTYSNPLRLLTFKK